MGDVMRHFQESVELRKLMASDTEVSKGETIPKAPRLLSPLDKLEHRASERDEDIHVKSAVMSGGAKTIIG